MPKKSKKFIDRKNAVTFHLVHRSQQDPLAADEEAPQHVLLPVKDKQQLSKKQRLEEQEKYGVFFDDDYNYLQHLRDTKPITEWVQEDKKDDSKEKPKLQLPSSVFASNVEEKVGLLNKAAPHTGPRLDLDPDIVAAMDDDFDFEDPNNELEDNFIELANASGSEDEDMDEFSDSNFDSDEEDDEVGSLDGPQYTFKDVETKSRFTDYSMSSSVIKRTEQLTLLDDRFEKLYNQYEENEIGALDCEEIEGDMPETSAILLKYAEEFETAMKKEQLDKDTQALKFCVIQEENEENEEMVPMEIPEKDKWDCESILSTYSNIYNHPKLISESKNTIKINMRTGMPVNVLGANKLTAKNLGQLNEQNDLKNKTKSVGAQSFISNLSLLSIRSPNETPEERKNRKKLLKEYRKERRQEKKANTEAFKEEAKRQTKININNRNNLQGNKII